MNTTIVPSIALWVFACAASLHASGPSNIKAPSLKLDAVATDGDGVFSFIGSEAYPWRFSLLEGSASASVELPAGEGDKDSRRFQLERFNITIKESSSGRGYTELLVSVQNTSDKELWLEPKISITLTGDGFEWFDGQQVRKIFSRRELLTGSMPFASVHKGGAGVALGIDPRQLVSHFRSALRKADQGGAELEFSSRMVIAPGATEERRFIAYPYTADFGYLNAVERFWKFFPENYQANSAVSPNVKGTVFGNIVWMNQHFQYHDGPKGKFNDKVSEVVRWIGGGWEWCYAGYGPRPGDWLCTEETSFDWKVNPDDPKSPEKTTKLRDVFKRNAKEHLDGLLGNYRRLEKHGVASLMYIIPSYCEYELADEKYSDSIYRDPQGAPRSAGPPWVGRYDKSYQMYSYGNSFGDYTLAAIRQIAERTPGLRGFSFDCIDRSNYPYTGPGVLRSPGKAYDEKLGVYVNTEIAHAKFGEAVHEIEKDGFRLALSGNYRATSGSYLSALAVDAAIIEHTPWDDRPRPDLVRLNLGTKSVSFLHGYERVPEIDKQTPEELVETVRMLQDFTILQAFRYGIYPSWKSALGSPKMIYYFEVFNDIFRHYGWQPTPGARGNENLWLSRYGAGRGSILSVGNATEEKIAGSLQILPSYFGGKSVAFVDYEGKGEVETRILEKEAVLEQSIAPSSVTLYAAALIWEDEFQGSVLGKREVTTGKQVRDRFTISPSSAGAEPRSAFAPDRPGYRITSVKSGDKSLDVVAVEGGVSFRHPAKETDLVIEYTPLVGIAEAEALEKLAFLDKDQNLGFQIVLTEDTLGTRREAMKLESFFSAYRFGLNEVDMVLPTTILTDASKADPSKLSIYIGSETSRVNTPLKDASGRFSDGEIFIDGNAIGLFTRQESDLTKAGNLLLKLLTSRYPYYGRLAISDKSIPGGAGIFAPSLFQKKTGMEYLPWEQGGEDKRQ